MEKIINQISEVADEIRNVNSNEVQLKEETKPNENKRSKLSGIEFLVESIETFLPYIARIIQLTLLKKQNCTDIGKIVRFLKNQKQDKS